VRFVARIPERRLEFIGDDVATIMQRVIDALPNGGKIFIKQGTYYPKATGALTGPTIPYYAVKLPDGIKITIESDGAVFKYRDQFMLFVHNHVDDVNVSPTFTSEITIRGIKIDRTGSGSNNTDIIHIDYAKKVVIEDVEIIDDYRETIAPDAGIRTINDIVAIIRNSRIVNKCNGIGAHAYLAKAENNYIENTAYYGIILSGLLDTSLWGGKVKLPTGFNPFQFSL